MHNFVTINLCGNVRHPIDELFMRDVIFRPSPLLKVLHLADCKRQKTVGILVVFVLKDVDDGFLRLPNVELFVANDLASLEDELLSLIKLGHKGRLGIASWIRLDLSVDVFS